MPYRSIAITCRVYSEGVAFKYEVNTDKRFAVANF